MTQERVALAIDVGGTGIKCALVDLDGVVRHSERHPTRADRGPDAVVATILAVAQALGATARTLGFDPVSAGVVVPGVVADGVAVWSANLGLRDVPLRRLVSERLDRPAALGHDVRAGALAEARLGAGRTTRRLLFLAIGTGIAGGFVLDGQIDEGAHGGAGELGHIAVRVGADARSCGCGGRGCLETYASAAAIARSYGSSATGQPATGQHVADLVAAGDPVAAKVWQEAVGALADGLLLAIALYDPAMVAIGGGLAEAGELLLDPVRTALQQRRTFHRLPSVVRAELGDEAGVQGAALLALEAWT